MSLFPCVAALITELAKKKKKHRSPHQNDSLLAPRVAQTRKLYKPMQTRCFTDGNRRNLLHFHNFANRGGGWGGWSLRWEPNLQKVGTALVNSSHKTVKSDTGPISRLKVLESAIKKSKELTWSAKFVEDPESSSWSDLELPSLSSITRSIGIFPFKQLMYRWQKLSHNS